MCFPKPQSDCKWFVCRYNISAQALKGCVNIISAGGISPYIKEEVGIGRGCSPELLVMQHTTRIAVFSCLTCTCNGWWVSLFFGFQVVRNAEFSAGSVLQKDDQDNSLQGDVNLSLGFKSTKPDGVLLQKHKDVRLSFEHTQTSISTATPVVWFWSSMSLN